MKIVYLTDYFNTPEQGGLLRTWEICNYLQQKGHEIFVICPSAHHMTGQSITKENKLYNKYTYNGIKVIKTYSSPNYRKTISHRILYYVTYPTLAFFYALKISKPDIIISSCPPLSILPLGFLLSKIKRRKYIIEMRDAWIEFAIARGMLPKFLQKLLIWMQKKLLLKAENIISVTPGIQKIMNDYTKQPNKNILVMNGFEEDIDESALFSNEDLSNLKQKHDLQNKFIVIYTGTLGMARDHEIFGHAGQLLSKYKNILFLIIGDGEKKKELQKFTKENNLSNFRFLPLQPRYMIPAFLKCSQVAINSIRKNDGLESSLSNKIFDYLGNGIPVIWAGEGDTSDFLEKSQGGIVVEPENAKQMAEAILELYENEELRQSLSQRGQIYVMQNFTRSKMLKNLNQILN